MHISLKRPIAFALLIALGVMGPAMAKTTTDVAGDWSGSTKTKVYVRRVGGDRDTVGENLTVVDGGTWTSISGEGRNYSGTWSPNGKKLDYDYDVAGRAALQTMLEDWALSYDVVAHVDINSITGKAKAKVKRNGTVLRTKAKVKFTITGDGQSRNGVAKIKGKFTPD